MRTFWIQTLGCKVNQYESEQIATLLQGRGLTRLDRPESADLRVVNTCSVTSEAAAKSGQAVRRATRLKVLDSQAVLPSAPRTIAVGCWATSNPQNAQDIVGRDAVISHHDDVDKKLSALLQKWSDEQPSTSFETCATATGGTIGLPPLHTRQGGHQRAFLKVQDGCDAHCTYCIIPQLRPTVWSKPIDDAVSEATKLVEAGHREIVLTGIFLGAFGQGTALRRRQDKAPAESLGALTEALCTRVPGLARLRFSSLEPGDLTEQLIERIKPFPQVVPHFHLPLQSGSSALLRRMNRQYTRDDYLQLLERVGRHFDHAALTTDMIVGFPGETDGAFAETLDIAERAAFIHIHAFPYSARPGTAAARWVDKAIPHAVAAERIRQLQAVAEQHSVRFRSHFIGQSVGVLVEASRDDDEMSHGRCERYFDVRLNERLRPGTLAEVQIDAVDGSDTIGTVVSIAPAPLAQVAS